MQKTYMYLAISNCGSFHIGYTILRPGIDPARVNFNVQFNSISKSPVYIDEVFGITAKPSLHDSEL